MPKSETWVERITRKICEWFDDLFPGGHAVATVGYSLAGLRASMPLPVDRKWRPPTSIFSVGNIAENANKAHVKTGKAAPESSCDFWAYCHISGNPCVWCGGKNSLFPVNVKHNDFSVAGKALCPSGTTNGIAWFGCCRNPNTKVAKMIAFMDCCGLDENDCGPGKDECHNWRAAKDWCEFGGNKTGYYCTVVIDFNNDKGCQ